MSAYRARFQSEYVPDHANDSSDNSCQKPPQNSRSDLLSANVAFVRGIYPESPPSFHDCVDGLLEPGQIPTDRTFEKATVVWLDKARKRRQSDD